MRRWAAPALLLAGALCPRLAAAAESDDPPDWGVQLGGPGFFEIMFRPRLGGPILLEVGAFGVAGGGFVGNASAGLLVELDRPCEVQPYLAFGGGGAGGCGEGEDGLGCSGLAYGYARLGLAFEVGPRPSNLITADVGGWFGGIDSDERGLRGFAIPMGGLGYYW